MFICMNLALFAAPASKVIEEWEMLSEDEKWLCLLSEPFVCAQKQSLTTVNPEPKNKGRVSKGHLQNGWNLHSKKDVLNLVDKYKNDKWGDNRNFIEAKAFYEKYPDYSIEEIATIECLELSQIISLYFYAETKDKMGAHGLFALDAVRILTVLRWSVAAGWLSETEAVETAKPLIKQILVSYDSWEDYAVHFALGWCYYTVYWGYDLSANQKSIVTEIKKYNTSTKSSRKPTQLISHDIKFPADNLNDSTILTYDDAIYHPGKDAEKWYLIRKGSYNGEKSLLASEKANYKSLLKEKSYIPAVAFLQAENLFGTENYTEISNYAKAFEKVKHKSYLYHEFYIWYGLMLLAENQSEQMLSLISNLENEKSYYYLNSFYKILKISEIMNNIEEGGLKNNSEYILTSTENYATEAVENLKIAKEQLPLKGDLQKIISVTSMFMNFHLFSIYSECAYMYYEARDLEKAIFYLEKAEENFALIDKSNTEFFNNEDIKNSKEKIDEIKNFVQKRYKKNENNDKDNIKIKKDLPKDVAI